VSRAETLNAETQAADRGSTLTLTRRLAALRRDTPALQSGTQRIVDLGEDVLGWVREEGSTRLVCAVNFAPAPVAVEVAGAVVLSTDSDRGDGEVRELRAGEGVIVAS
jgi:alpha-glucosidase